MYSHNLHSNMFSIDDITDNEVPSTQDTFCNESFTNPLECSSISEIKTYDVDSVIYASAQTLLGLYRRHIGKDSSTNDTNSEDAFKNDVVVSGGLQSLLNRQAKTGDSGEAANGRQKTCGFHNLPDSLQLVIFNWLPVRDLCVIAAVCRHWFMLSHDELLWKQRLTRDQDMWTHMSHLTNPYMFHECAAELSSKEIYLRCSPEVLCRPYSGITSHLHHVGSLLRSFLPQRAPKLAMVGPGMETGTRGIVRTFLGDKNNTFTTTGIIPGAFGGVGAGFSLRTSSGVNFNLSPLYTNEAKYRNQNDQRQRMQQNRMFVNGAAVADGEEVVLELSPHVRRFCRSVDGLIYVVDGKSSSEDMQRNIAELSALLLETSHDHPIPLLVLNCTPVTPIPQDGGAATSQDGATSDVASHHMPVVAVMRHLRLTSISNPWTISDCSLDDSSSMLPSLQWLVGQANNR